MSNIFFIDSENVGDSWTLMLDSVDPEDELLVFYTQKSPHMSYKNLIRLKNSSKEVSFIECFEGSNALDFQLVTELGYRIALDSEGANRFFVVSNDNGFEAAVRYWRRRNVYVKRFTGKVCASIPTLIDQADEAGPVTQKSEERNAAAEAAVSEAVPVETTTMETAEEPVQETAAEPVQEPAAAPVSDPEENAASADVQSKDAQSEDEESPVVEQAKEVLYIIGRENLANLHEALMQLYGNEKCKLLYNIFKSDPAYANVPDKYKDMTSDERAQCYCNLVYRSEGYDGDLPDDFAQVVTKSWRNKRNLNSLRAALQSRFGKENGKQSYMLIKSHVKILDNIG